MNKYKYIFCIALIVAGFFQAFGWLQFMVLDGGLWANEAKYVETGSNKTEEFNFLGAYGHPGGPVIEGTIAIHHIANTSYDNAINAFLILFDGLIISFICVLCYALKKDHLWWIIVLVTLSINPLYYQLTPTSAVAALLFVLLSLYTLYIYRNPLVKNRDLIIWTLVAGLLVSTRFDIGGAAIFAYSIFLVHKIGWRKILAMLVSVCILFCVFDPFMWFMPVQHIHDLIYKLTFHYAEISATYVTFPILMSISGLAFVSMLLGIGFILSKKKTDLESPLPLAYLSMILVLTAVLYNIFLTAHEQAIRYFVPLIFLWEIFLPLFMFALIPYISSRYAKTEKRKVEINKNSRAILALVLTSFYLLSLLNSIAVSLTFSVFR